ncbi:uncharacterized protein C8Q71DRAFT_394321 [Rhodofomes roseus]|uniref:Condensation domain-containing protein n=1 Tax=Rhodofomes roseus TaxID=34475 RepID=A0ABQ8K0D7_9APHY|nr:uncharacterized protein C8Q71DRAFT_394321 [Rhodofomes roseus]KAH9829912.1 hypothetical protein C8Q71DRAFT_394321 [Rhodofomes roseus]
MGIYNHAHFTVMASAPTNATAPPSALLHLDTNEKPAYPHLFGTALTSSRPLGGFELGLLSMRGSRGYSDIFGITPLTCSGGYTVTDDNVVHAWAALRLRHPLLSSTVAFHAAQRPEFVYASPLTMAHALRAARAQIEFHTFDDQDTATEALRDRWLTPDSEDALDVRSGTCSLYWGRDADAGTGRYILGIMMAHAVADGRRRANIVRCMLELLATPGRAQRELAAHFAGETPVVEIPPAMDSLLPDTSKSDPAELAKAKEVFDELIKFRSKRLSGLVPDGDLKEENFQPRFRRQIWSIEETRRILMACKARGVTITHLANVSSAFASVQCQGAAQPSDSEDNYYFELCQAFDIHAKLTRVSSNGETETALHFIGYPVILSIPKSKVASYTTGALWDVARQFKARHEAYVNSPYFWNFKRFYDTLAIENYMAQMAGRARASVPNMSSLGNLKSILPVRYPVQTSAVVSVVNGPGPEAVSAEIRVLDEISSAKVDPLTMNFAMWTFDDRLKLQFKWNSGRVSDGLINDFFNRVVGMISQVADDEGTM